MHLFTTHPRNSQKGFTLLEMLIVIVIIGLLAAVGLGSFMSSQKKGRDSRRKADLTAITAALEMYYNDFDQYPTSNGNQEIEGCDAGTCNWNGIWEKNGTVYMVQIPNDPGGNSYRYESDGQTYQLYARLENDQDLSVAQCGSGLGMYQGLNCNGGGCNYVVASSNTSPSVLPSIVCE